MRPPALYVDVARTDHLIDQNRDFHTRLQALRIPHDDWEKYGKHDWSYWQRNVGESLDWLARRLAP